MKQSAPQISQLAVPPAPSQARPGVRAAKRLPGRGHFYTVPALILIAVVLVVPSVYAFYASLFDVSAIAPANFIGWTNYANLLDSPTLLSVVWRSTLFTIAAVVVTMALAMATALWINTLKRGTALVAQMVIVLPWVISQVVGALLFKWVFVNDIGVGLYWLHNLGLHGFDPLSNGFAAMAVLIVYASWKTLGFVVILLLAGIKAIPASYYEAAHVDGATAMQRFWAITLPLLRTPMAIATVIVVLGNLNNIEAPLIVTAGGPAGATTILSFELYTRAFINYDFGTAIALGVGMIVANVILSLLYVSLVKRNG